MIKRMIIMLILCGIVLGGVFGFKMFGMKMMMQHMAAMGDAPTTISTVKVGLEEWKQELKAVGTLRAVKGTDLSAEVAGTVENIFMESGQEVTEGTVLVQLRSKEDFASLQALAASTRLAELTVERDEKQLKAQAISQAAYDADVANLESLKAQMEAQKSLLEKKTITAPFSGRLGLRKVDVGQYLAVGTPIVSLQQLDPIYIDFFIPQQSLPKVSVGQKVQVDTDVLEGKSIEGEVSAIESKIDETTRNIQVRASIPNPDKVLRPGMFARISLVTGEPQKLLTLPQTAITFNPYGSTVFVVKKDGTDDKGQPKLVANMAFVETGPTRGDQVSILKGIQEGDEIVSAGQMKLQNGAKVAINNSVQPSSDANPSPMDK